MASGENNDLFHWFHLLWLAAAGMFWKLWAIVDRKADQDSVDDKHRENRETLAYIRDKLDDMGDTLTKVQVDVANLKGRGGFNGH